jgi:hypothetical protein
LNLRQLRSVLYVTAYPDRLPDSVLRHIDLFVALGEKPEQTIAKCQQLVGESPQGMEPSLAQDGQLAIAWWRENGPPAWFRLIPPRGDHQRHRHTYLDGDMEPRFRFHFRGSKGELNLPAQNLRIFMQLGQGVDDETWTYHLRRGDYASWFRDVIKDTELADAAERIERSETATPADSRRYIFDLITKRYEAPT